MARRQGWPEEVLARLAEFEQLGLPEPERLALRLAETVTRDSNAVSSDFFAALRAHFDEGQIIELIAVIGLFNYFNRFNNALQMEPTRPGER